MSKIIGNFLQTYSTNRIETAKVISHDISLNYFLNFLDFKFLSFHNLANNTEYCKKYASYIKKNLSNVEFLIYTEPYYTHTVTRHIEMLEKKGCTDLFFTQDDVVCLVPDKDRNILDKVYSFYKNSDDVNLLSLNVKGTRLIKAGAIPKQIREISKEHNLYAYEFSTDDFTKANLFEMDDSTYLAKIDLIRTLYNEKYKTYLNMDQAECHVKETCMERPISRWVLNKRLFRYLYYHGMHVYTSEMRVKELKILEKLFNYKKTGNAFNKL